MDRVLRVIRYFANPAICENMIRLARWPGGKPVCPGCSGVRISLIETRNLFRCKDCRKQFSSRVGTLFEDSHLHLGQWYSALFVVIHYPNLSCQKLSDLLGVTTVTAWSMRRKLRYALSLIPTTGGFHRRFPELVRLPKTQIIIGLNQAGLTQQ